MAFYVYPPISLSSSPIQYLLNGTATQVTQDTATPGNSRPLPIIELDSNGNPVSDGLAPVETGDLVDTSTLNNPGWTTVRTLTQDIKKIRFVHNGGTQIEVAINGTKVGYIPPGEKDTLDFKASSGDTIDLRTVSGAGSAGDLYMTYFA